MSTLAREVQTVPKMKKNIYILEESCATNETGAYYPQITKMQKGYKYEAENSVYYTKRYYDKIPPFTPNFDYFVMNGKSKRSDFLSNSMMGKNGFIINQKVKDVLKDFLLPKHEFFPVSVFHKQEFIENYFFFQLVCDLSNIVDYQNSIFQVEDIGGRPLEEIFFQNREEYFEKKEQLKIQAKVDNTHYFLWAKKNVLQQDVDYDLFRIGGTFDNNIYIKENLKNALIENKITGCEIIYTDRVLLHEQIR